MINAKQVKMMYVEGHRTIEVGVRSELIYANKKRAISFTDVTHRENYNASPINVP